MSFIPIILDRKDAFVIIGRLQLPDNKDVDHAILLRKDDEIYKCFKGDAWVCSFCKKCTKYLCTDYSTISRHCSVCHKNLKSTENAIQKQILKLVLLNNLYLSFVENPDFTALFSFDVISRKTVTNYFDIISKKVREKIKEILATFD